MANEEVPRNADPETLTTAVENEQARRKPAKLPILGVVIDSESRSPISGVAIQFQSIVTQFRLPAIQTDEHGKFSIEVMSGESFSVIARSTDGREGHAPLVFAGDEIVIELPHLVTLTVAVNSERTSSPVGGAYVIVRQKELTGSGRAWSATGQSDSGGQCVIEGAPSATLIVSAVHEEFGSVSRIVNLAELTDDTVRLAFYGGRIIRGIVTDELSRRPLEGVSVNDDIGNRYQTDRGGVFLINARDAVGIKTLHAELDGYCPTFMRLKPHETDETIEIQLNHGSSLVGFVFDSQGNRVADADVFTRLSFQAMVGSREFFSRSSQTDMVGRFELTSVPLGSTGMIHSRHSGQVGQTLISPAGFDGEEVTITLQEPVDILGVVHVDGANQSSDVRVELCAISNSSGHRRSSRMGSSKLAGDGTFTFSNLPVGSYDVNVSFGSGRRSQKLTRRLSDLAPGETCMIQFVYPGASNLGLAGSIVDGDGNSVARVTVVASSASGDTLSTRSTRNGRFEFHLAPGEFAGRVQLWSLDTSGQYMNSAAIETFAGKLDSTLTMGRYLTDNEITVRLESTSGIPITDAYIFLENKSSMTKHGKMGVPNESGHCTLKNLPSDRYLVEVFDPKGLYLSTDPLDIHLPTDTVVITLRPVP